MSRTFGSLIVQCGGSLIETLLPWVSWTKEANPASANLATSVSLGGAVAITIWGVAAAAASTATAAAECDHRCVAWVRVIGNLHSLWLGAGPALQRVWLVSLGREDYRCGDSHRSGIGIRTVVPTHSPATSWPISFSSTA